MSEFVEIITDLINNCGFPIAAFLLMFFQNKKTTETVDKLSASIDNLDASVKSLWEKIERSDLN